MHICYVPVNWQLNSLGKQFGSIFILFDPIDLPGTHPKEIVLNKKK